MKKIIPIIISFMFLAISFPITAKAKPSSNFFSKADLIQLELYLMRKGTKIEIAILSSGSREFKNLIIERKSTAPLSTYRKVITLSPEQLELLKTEGKIILSDNYPESRQLDSYYRLVYENTDDVVKTPPAILLMKANSEEAVTFGDHELKDPDMFVTEEDDYIPTYEELNIIFKVQRAKNGVLITIALNGEKFEGEWAVERKSSKPLSSYRKVKTISEEDKTLCYAGEHVFIDKYPESRQLDSYYRLVIIDKEGNRLELPSVFLQGESK